MSRIDKTPAVLPDGVWQDLLRHAFKDILKLQFDAIDRLGYQVSYEDAQHVAGQFLAALD